MLTPEYLESCTDSLLALYDQLNQSIVEDIARRIAKTNLITESAIFQMEKLQGAGLVYKDALKRISQVSGYTESELQRMFEESGVTNLKYEDDIYTQAGYKPIPLKQSPEMLKMLQAGLDKTNGVMHNLTLTTANMAQNAYVNACDAAYLKVASGAFSYQEAIKQAIKQAANQGIEVLYPSGHKDKIDVAVRRSVLAGVNQTMSKVSLKYTSEVGCDYVETTAHSGARPDHASWQGQVFCISGKDKKYPPFSVTGYGSGSGLCGWNCRHSFHAFVPGVSVPSYTREMLDDYAAKKYDYDGQKLTDYECSQMQRRGERSIRETKRKLTAYDATIKATNDKALKETLQNEFGKESARLKQQEQQLKDFCKQTKRRMDSARVQVHAVKDSSGRIVGFNRSVSQKAVHANRTNIAKYSQYGYNKSGSIIVTDDWTNKARPTIPKEYKSYAVIETVETKKGKAYHNITLHDGEGKMIKQIHSGNHGNPKKHPYGENGEHVHLIEWDDEGNVTRSVREMTEAEKKEYGDIL